ncbi:MAG: tetratricopeptide repeat-containing sensor histidine kinase, partial [Bacteroidota bacterium]
MIANFYRYIANGYKDNGNLEKSLETAQKVLSIREAIGDKKGVANILNAIALIFQDNNDLDEALTYFEQALQIAEESKDRKQQALLLSTIGSNYALRNKCDTALMYFRSSLSLLKDQQFNTSMALPLSRIGACLEQTDQLDSAIIYLTQAYDLVKDIEKGQIETRILITLGKVNRKLKQPKQALQNFRQALSIAESRGLRQDQAELNFQLSQTLAEQGQYQTAFNYIQQYQILKDSLFNEENTKQLARLEATYEFEQEKQALEYQNEQEKQVLDVQIRKQRTLQIITAVALALSLLIFFLVHRLQGIKRRNAVEQEQYKAAIQGKQLQLEQQERVRLEEMDEFKSRFFTNISHEFRTPLTIINGMAGQVQSKPEQWLDRGTQMIRQNAQNLLQLVNQILDLRKLESSQLSLDLIQGDILAYLRYIAATHASLAESKGVYLELDLEEESLVMDFDPDKLMKIISNLLSNAIKFTDTNDRVTLAASSEQQQLKIEIRDTGIGIPKDQLIHIFDRYFQVEHSNNHNPQGSGIGLALTQELVKLLDGEISVESEVHKGTCFTILFPIRQNAPLAEVLFKSSTPTKEKQHSLNSRMSDDKKEELPSLLIVEDNKDMMEFLLASLDEHYQIETVFDGAVGIEKA